MQSPIEIQLIDTTNCADELLEHLLDFGDEMGREKDSDHIPEPRHMRKASWRRKNPEMDIFRYIATIEGKVVGYAGLGHTTPLSPAFDEIKHMAWVWTEVLPQYRNRGIGTQLAKQVVTKATERGIAVLEADSAVEEGHKFASKLQGELIMEGGINRLYIENVDWELMQKWVKDGPKRAPGVKLLEFSDVPEDIIQEYVELYSETENQAPTDGTEYVTRVSPESRRREEERKKELDIVWLTLVAQEEDGALSGLTEVYYYPALKIKISQELTGVKQEYRGRGLGKWLKSEMLLRLKQRYPDIRFVDTGNADTNAPMLAINHQMGFSAHIKDKDYKFEVSKLAEMLLD